MRCFICDAAISPEDVHLDRRYMHEKYGPVSPCVKCQIEIDEIFDDHLTEEELDRQLNDEDTLLNDPQLEEIFELSQADSRRPSKKG